MTVEGEYLGMRLTIDDLDGQNQAYFRHCSEGEYHLQQCSSCDLVRYPPTTACPWCSAAESSWIPVEGRGVVYSYSEVHHAIQPAFRDHLPYLILLVELDTQRGLPTEHEALRLCGNLVTPAGELAPPEVVKSVGIGTRVKMVLVPIANGLAIPQWTVDVDAPTQAPPWRYPQEGGSG